MQFIWQMWWCCANCTKFLSASRYVHHYAPICYKINDNWHSVSGGDSIHCDRRLDQMRSWICVSLSSVVTGSCRLCHSSEKRISWSAHVPFLYLSVVVCYICAGTDPRWSGTWNPKQGWGQTRRNDDIHCICTEASCQTWKWLMQEYCSQKLIYLQPESWAPIGLMHASVRAQRSQGNISFECVAWL